MREWKTIWTISEPVQQSKEWTRTHKEEEEEQQEKIKRRTKKRDPVE